MGFNAVGLFICSRQSRLFIVVNIIVQHCWAWISLQSDVTMLKNIVDNCEQYGQQNIVASCSSTLNKWEFKHVILVQCGEYFESVIYSKDTNQSEFSNFRLTAVITLFSNIIIVRTLHADHRQQALSLQSWSLHHLMPKTQSSLLPPQVHQLCLVRVSSYSVPKTKKIHN